MSVVLCVGFITSNLMTLNCQFYNFDDMPSNYIEKYDSIKLSISILVKLYTNLIDKLRLENAY